MIKERNLIIENNKAWYKKTYNSLIETRKSRGLDKATLDYYTERHHIIPRCMGGKDEDDNYVLLTAREHIIAHMLLSSIYPDNYKLLKAAVMLTTKICCNGEKITISSRLASYFKEKYSKSQKGKQHSEEHRRKQSEGLIKFNKENPGFWKKEEYCNRMPLEARKRFSDNWKGDKNPNYGGISESHRENLKKSHIGHKFYGNTPKQVQGPDGTIYNSIKEASIAAGENYSTFKKHLRKLPYSDKHREYNGYKII